MQRQTLQSSFSGGVVQDVPRHQMPIGTVWSMTDLIPNIAGEPLVKRGPWSNAYTAVGSAIKGLGWIGSKLVAFTANGHFWLLQNVGGVITAVDKGGAASAVITEVTAGTPLAGKPEVQKLTIYADAGTFILWWNNSSVSCAWNITAATLLTNLQGIGVPITATPIKQTLVDPDGVTYFTFTITFNVNGNQSLIGCDPAGLTLTASSATAYVVEATKGVSGGPYNEKQALTVVADGGQYSLGFLGAQSYPINYNSFPSAIKNELVAATNIGSGNVKVEFQTLPVPTAIKALTPKVYYRLGDVSGTTAKDEMGFANGTYSSVSLNITGMEVEDLAPAVYFIDAGTITTAYSAFTAGSSRTFLGTAQRVGQANIDTLFAGTSTVNPTSLVCASGSNDVTFNNGGSSQTWTNAWPGLSTTAWWALTYNDTTKVAELFINGVSKGTKTMGSAYSAPGNFTIGRNGANNPWNGYQQDVAVVESILTPTQITSIYTAGSNPSWGPVYITFVNQLGNTAQPLITVDQTLLTYSGSSSTWGQLRPVYFNGNLFWGQTAFDGTNNPLDMSKVFPTNSYASLAFKSRLVTTDGQTIYFSSVLDHKTWDAYSYVKATKPIVGLAALPNMIMIFSAGACERLRGTTPPSTTTAGDFILEPAFNEGCIDVGSIATYKQNILWANETGVFMSDGAAIVNLTTKAGISEYWRKLMATMYKSAGSDQTVGTMAAGVYGDYYVLSCIPNGGTATTLVYNFSSGRWFFFSNLSALMFAESTTSVDQLFMALSGRTTPGEFSTCFTKAGDTTAAMSDPDGTAIQPVLELPFYRPSTGKARFKELFLGVTLDNTSSGGGGTATLQFDYVGTISGSAYTNITDDASNPITVSDTGGPAVKRIPLHLNVNGLGLRIRQIGTSRKTAFHELEAIIRVLEGRL